MGLRRRGREFALQMLFQIDMTGQDPQEVQSLFWQRRTAAPEVRRFAEELFQGTLEIRARLDCLLMRTSAHWKLERMPIVDRNLLRLALYEMLFQPDTPRVVVIDEAIEIAKRYGSEDSGQFINGLLDRLRERIAEVESSQPAASEQTLEHLEQALAADAEGQR